MNSSARGTTVNVDQIRFEGGEKAIISFNYVLWQWKASVLARWVTQAVKYPHVGMGLEFSVPTN
jgi:hypothetical protein